MRRVLMRSVWLGLGLLAACGGSTPTPDAEEVVDCSQVTGVDTFVVGLEKVGAANMVDFKMMSADPAPPARNDNTWVFQFHLMNGASVGAAMDGATIVATPYMPAHQHGSPKQVLITPTGNAGEYTLSPVFLWMPGVWQTTIQATASGGATTDSAVYSFCIPN